MQAPHDGLRKTKLPGVAQADRRDRIEAPSELMSTRCRQATANIERNPRVAALHQADQLLRDPCDGAQLSLCQAGHYARNAQLMPKSDCQIGGARMASSRGAGSKCLHARSLVLSSYRPRIRRLQTVLVHGHRWTGHRAGAQVMFVPRRRAPRIGADAQLLFVSRRGSCHPAPELRSRGLSAREKTTRGPMDPWRGPAPGRPGPRRRGTRRPSGRRPPDSPRWRPRSRSRTPRRPRSRRHT